MVAALIGERAEVIEWRMPLAKVLQYQCLALERMGAATGGRSSRRAFSLEEFDRVAGR